MTQSQRDNAVNAYDSAGARLDLAGKAVVAAQAQLSVIAAQRRDVEERLAKTEVRAPADGIVIFAGEKAAYGNTIVIDHGRDITTLFGHLQRMLVTPGQKVERGQHVGHVGNTGRSTGPHLHYEVRINGVPVNPRRYVVQ